MKKNWIFIILSLAMLFSLGFIPTPEIQNANPSQLEAANSISVDFLLNNKSPNTAVVTIESTQPYFSTSFYVPKGTKTTKSIKVAPGKYQVIIGLGSGCQSIVKNITITKKTKKVNLPFTCGKFK